MKKKLIYLIALILLIGTVSGCELNNDNLEREVENEVENEVVEYKPEVGGEIILPLTNFDTLNPLMTENTSYYYFSKLIFESLFEFHHDLNVKGLLVEDYSISEDGRIINLNLKDNILWHDGQPLTSEDVEFTVNTLKYGSMDSTYNKMFAEALGAFSPSDTRRILNIEVIDEKNFTLTFDRSFSNNLEVLTFPIIPKHVFAEGVVNSRDYTKALELENYTPIGTGPFKFDHYENMKEITLMANEEYREGRPYIDKVLGKVFDNEEEVLRAFEAGQINMATTIGVDWARYNQNYGISSIEFISPNYEFLGFNFNKEVFQEEEGKTLRKAMSYGINRQRIIEEVYLGHSTQVDVPIHPNSWLLSEAANTFGYNLDMAKKEIGKLNPEELEEDGRDEEDGNDNISLELLTNTLNPMRLKTAEIIKENLKDLGIDVNIIPQIEPTDEITEEKAKEQWEEINQLLSSGQYDMVLLGWQLSLIPDLSFAFHSSQVRYNSNFINYSSEEMDDLLENTFSNGNREEKKKEYEKLQKLIVKDLPYISLFFKNKSLLLNDKIKGELKPTFDNPYDGIEEIYIPKDLQ